ncbi:hypothetical protein ACTXT7_016970 [Hymenolepis weldensis]
MLWLVYEDPNKAAENNSFSSTDEEGTDEPPQTQIRQPLYLSKLKLANGKSCPRISTQSADLTPTTPDVDNWKALSQASSSTRWRNSNGPMHHVCPLSENTLLNGYESESPDEVTLVKTACKYGCKLLQRGLDFVIIWLPGDGLIRVEVLKVLPFLTKRKRMSIIIRHPNTDQIVLYCKGADSVILPLLDPQNGWTAAKVSGIPQLFFRKVITVVVVFEVHRITEVVDEEERTRSKL